MDKIASGQNEANAGVLTKTSRRGWEKNLTDLTQLIAKSDGGIEFELEPDPVLTDLMAKLQNKTQLEVLPDPQ